MSQIGRRPIDIPENVEVTVKSDSVLVKGKLGELVQSYNPIIKVSKVDNAIEVSRSTDLKHERELHGLYGP